MRVLEIVAAQIADDLKKGGTKFEMDPDRVTWPDGTVTKKIAPSKKGKKNPPPGSKHGVFGVIVAQYGGKKKIVAPLQNAVTIEPSQSGSSQSSPATTAVETSEKPKQTRRCKYVLSLYSVLNFFNIQDSKGFYPAFKYFQYGKLKNTLTYWFFTKTCF